MVLDLTLDDHERLTAPESKTREYKQNLGNPERVLQSVVAFANSAGGELIVGVHDDRTVVGVRDPLMEQQRLAHLIADSIQPQLAPAIDLVTLADKTVIVATIPLGSQRPYHLKSGGKFQGTYYRTGAGNRQAGAAMVRELERSAKQRTFDQLPCLDATMADIDLNALSELMGRRMTPVVLQTLELTCEEQGKTVPTNGGILVGYPHPERFMPFAWVQCARFRGPTKRDITDQRDIYGPLPLAVDKVMDFLKANAFLSADFDIGPKRREDVWSIPLEPLEELVVNALVHSSYDSHGTAIKVAFLDDEIWIESPGGLVPGMTVDLMKQGVSQVRNPVLARVFKELSLIERWGTGIPDVIKTLQEAGLPEPDFEETVERLRITVHIQNHDPMRFRIEQTAEHRRRRGEPGDSDHFTTPGAQVPKAGTTTEHQVFPERHQVEHQVTAEKHQVEHQVLGQHAASILRMLRRGPASRAEVFAAINVHSDRRAFLRHLHPLIELGLAAMTNPDNPTASNQRYFLTDAGRRELALLDEGSGVL
ncbi:MAG: putative DNA binding domain-containing protein [Propionibacteriaceae bacterium]|jgi:predicted HTH transcriptional regulator|nr:putative DNA binding domain-containing protein [Propionibacteriaceae bacterium]